MSLTSGANKWASRAVIILQLAAWSAVGIVLLQKGLSTLQKTPDMRNLTKVQSLRLTSTDVEEEEPLGQSGHQNLSVIPVHGPPNPREVGNFHLSKKPSVFTDKENLRILEDALNDEQMLSDAQAETPNFPSLGNQNPMDENENSKKQNMEDPVAKPFIPDRIDEILDLPKSNSYLETGKGEVLKKPQLKLKISKVEPAAKKAKSAESERLGSLLKNSKHHLIENNQFLDLDKTDKTDKERVGTPSDVVSSTKKYEDSWESRRKLRISHLSGGGAAAAVAMVAVGAVMLVLGPAVIILRALDERRQERRFQKLAGQDDLPPSYEQATLMDEAPRYSTLSLNTILGPPPPPSPTTARVQFV